MFDAVIKTGDAIMLVSRLCLLVLGAVAAVKANAERIAASKFCAMIYVDISLPHFK
jgi:hypothetical protein